MAPLAWRMIAAVVVCIGDIPGRLSFSVTPGAADPRKEYHELANDEVKCMDTQLGMRYSEVCCNPRSAVPIGRTRGEARSPCNASKGSS